MSGVVALSKEVLKYLDDMPMAERDEREARIVGAMQAVAQSQQAIYDGKEPETVFESLGDGRYGLTVSGLGIGLSLDHLRRERHQLHGELAVRCSLAGARVCGSGILSLADFNLSSERARETRARHLASRTKTKEAEIDWLGYLEEFAQQVIAADRAGTPAVSLRELPRPTPEETLVVEGLPLLGRHPLILFGDGGTAKSLLALWMAGTPAQRGRRVGFFDWELAGEDHRLRLEKLFGADMPEITYLRCDRPLVTMIDRVWRTVREHELDYAIFDSIAFACDGPPEAAEVAGRYFQALRQLGEIGSMHVAHVSKADGADRKPFGSAFWSNGARSTWNVKISDNRSGGSLSIALHHRKANLGPRCSSLGFRIDFDKDRTTIRRQDVAEVPDLAVDLPLPQRVHEFLREGPRHRYEIDDEFADAKKETLRRTLNREIKRGRIICFPGTDGLERIGLSSGDRRPS